ncbi:hypothetical protein Gohar_028460 [Gossypium harknessii]|uniref:Uncharacterized protein n=1 Tax=Gossypium harknessii TaxID=34285 RepID=A0A7J9I7E7_9ROSI|nr:hypothetical protein [Gossypium harknessii]
MILAETFRSLNACQRTVFSENYSLLKELAVTPRRNDIRKMDGDPSKSPG